MKIALIIVAILITAFIVVQYFSLKSQNNIEEYPYNVIESFDDFELRQYDASLFTAVELPTNKYEEGSRKGFSVLAGYIFGGNEREESIAMTSPVAMSLEDSMTVMFMVPSKYKEEELPKPNSSVINFRNEPSKKMAAMQFGGWANSEKLESYKVKMLNALEREGLEYKLPFYFFGYNPPYDLINRRNEIVVEIE